MIIRGTTPYHTFGLPLRAEQISEVWITYMQNEAIVLDKTLTGGDIELVNTEDLLDNASMECSPNDFSQAILHLSQEDTLKFEFYKAAEKNIAVIQVRFLDIDGEAYASDPLNDRIMGVIKGGKIQ